MTPTPEIVWQSPHGRVELRRGLYWCYIGGQHVGTQLYEIDAIDLVKLKLGGAG